MEGSLTQYQPMSTRISDKLPDATSSETRESYETSPNPVASTFFAYPERD